MDLLVERYPSLKLAKEDIIAVYLLMEECYGNGGKLLVAGKNSSAADADHIVGGLMKGFKTVSQCNAMASSLTSQILKTRHSQSRRELRLLFLQNQHWHTIFY